MVAGCARCDITPEEPVWMDGMIRSRKSTGVHDRIYARVLMLSPDVIERACVLVSVEVCGLTDESANMMREAIQRCCGICRDRIVIAATHTHSGPATMGLFNQREDGYLSWLAERVTVAVREAASSLKPVKTGADSGTENTISHYRRLHSRDGSVIMNWEEYSPDDIIGPLGEADPEVGVIRIDHADRPGETMAVVFNHAGHPNVMSGDNYLISGDYAGLAMREIEERYGCTALFLNGAQGTMDIDGLRDRDWAGVERTGKALADAVASVMPDIPMDEGAPIRAAHMRYHIPPRRITLEELDWAKSILSETGGTYTAMADGVGDDYKASLFMRIHKRENRPVPIEQTCIAVGGTALISFPGELFTEIGMEIKRQSPFNRTYIIGLANGEIGYVPTRRAITEGGYAVSTREVDAAAEDIVTANSLALLEKTLTQEEGSHEL